MFPFLAIFIIFIIILTYCIKKNDADQQKIQEEFWEKERLANSIRKKDISSLDYITIPFEKIPHKLHTETEKKLFTFAEKPLLNLSGISNTDLKLSYGLGNMEYLSECDTNYLEYISLLPKYTTELLEAGEKESALLLLEHAIHTKADSKQVYSQLASLYNEAQEPHKIEELLKSTEEFSPLIKNAIQNELKTYLP